MAGTDAPTVLIVDDDLELLRQLREAFLRAGFQVSLAVDGRQGLVRFKAEAPDVVVTDIIMPTREGVETILAMKKHRADAKIIAISGGWRVGPDAFLTLARHVGADRVLPKPFRPSQLVELARQVLKGQSTEAGA